MVENQPVDGYDIIIIQRNITPFLLEALKDTPVVMLTGTRQIGKSTLIFLTDTGLLGHLLGLKADQK
ncbi:MAG TPA: hypothetical protein DEO84_05355 [candidate division Zixibacteria bacterium]|nr:hypothetical protein [candidate division Zixibacteria bacterium]